MQYQQLTKQEILALLVDRFKDKRVVKSTLNNFITLSELMNVKEYGSMYCEFHGERREKGSHPSAKFFSGDSDGIERIYCWVCKRQYTAYDYVKIVMEQNPVSYLLHNISHLELLNYTENLKFDDTYSQEKENQLDKILKESKSISELIELISFGEKVG